MHGSPPAQQAPQGGGVEQRHIDCRRGPPAEQRIAEDLRSAGERACAGRESTRLWASLRKSCGAAYARQLDSVHRPGVEDDGAPQRCTCTAPQTLQRPTAEPTVSSAAGGPGGAQRVQKHIHL